MLCMRTSPSSKEASTSVLLQVFKFWKSKRPSHKCLLQPASLKLALTTPCSPHHASRPTCIHQHCDVSLLYPLHFLTFTFCLSLGPFSGINGGQNDLFGALRPF
eukprot:1149282-Pelagomonas_calceolata.AAC.2